MRYTDEELRQFGLDLFAGKIFTSNHLQKIEAIEMSFPVLIFLNEKIRKELTDQKAAVFFEYLDKAGPRSINGRPIFMSCRWLTQEEWEKVVEYYEKFKRAAEGVKV
jgi:hypothetical protein